jgi:hypothetical protein
MLTVSNFYRYAAHYDCNLLHVTVAPGDEMKNRVLESYVTSRNDFFPIRSSKGSRQIRQWLRFVTAFHTLVCLVFYTL